MSVAHIVTSCNVVRTPRVLQTEGWFDLPPTQRCEQSWDIALPLEERPWHIGLIVGPSGSGKSTTVRALFGAQATAALAWSTEHAVVDAFPSTMGIKEITSLLSSVGFSSPPAWLRPFQALSTGEQFRVALARSLAEQPRLAVVDEFTSSVDRTTARIGSVAVAKAVRRRRGRLVAVTCHSDILDWLQPDWILHMPLGKFSWRAPQLRPELRLTIQRAGREWWQLFKSYHYLNTSLSPAARCFMAMLDGRPAAFAAAIHSPHPQRSSWREHRTVCLPDFQGIGIGNALSEYVASLFAATGKPYHSVTGHPAMIAYRAGSPNWRMLRPPGLPKSRSGVRALPSLRRAHAVRRFTATFQYMGPARPAAAQAFGIRTSNNTIHHRGTEDTEKKRKGKKEEKRI